VIQRKEIKTKAEKEDLIKFISKMIDFLVLGANDYT